MILKRILYTLAVLAALVVFSVNCNGPERGYIISERRFIEVLADIHLADAIAVDNMNKNDTFTYDSAALYHSVLQKHKVTRAQFDSTMVYYSAHPEDFQEIYNKVISRLKKMEEELAKEPGADSLPGVGTEERE